MKLTRYNSFSDDELVREVTSKIIPAEQRHPNNPVLEMLEELAERLSSAIVDQEVVQGQIDQVRAAAGAIEAAIVDISIADEGRLALCEAYDKLETALDEL